MGVELIIAPEAREDLSRTPRGILHDRSLEFADVTRL